MLVGTDSSTRRAAAVSPRARRTFTLCTCATAAVTGPPEVAATAARRLAASNRPWK